MKSIPRLVEMALQWAVARHILTTALLELMQVHVYRPRTEQYVLSAASYRHGFWTWLQIKLATWFGRLTRPSEPIVITILVENTSTSLAPTLVHAAIDSLVSAFQNSRIKHRLYLQVLGSDGNTLFPLTPCRFVPKSLARCIEFSEAEIVYEDAFVSALTASLVSQYTIGQGATTVQGVFVNIPAHDVGEGEFAGALQKLLTAVHANDEQLFFAMGLGALAKVPAVRNMARHHACSTADIVIADSLPAARALSDEFQKMLE